MGLRLAAVTGASGFIGSAVVRQLLLHNYPTRALIEPGANIANLDALDAEGLGRIERVTVDVTDQAKMREALRGVDTLFHLAALYKTWIEDPAPLYRINIGGTVCTLLAAQAMNVRRVVYTSSIAAVGRRRNGEPSDESVPFNQFDIANDYVLSKHLAEQVALEFAKSGLPLVVVNPGFPFGPRDRAPTPTGAIILSILRGEIPALSGGGFCAIDVDDVAGGHLLAAEKGRVGERYILANHNVSFDAFVTLTCEVAGTKPPRVRLPNTLASAYSFGVETWARHVSHKEPITTFKSTRYVQRFLKFDSTKAHEELGLARTPLEDSIRRAVTFFRNQGRV